MEPPTSLIVIVVIAVVATVVGLFRTVAQLRRLGPGPEREALRNSLWSMAGGAAIVLCIAMDLPPLSLPLAPRLLVLGGAVGLVATGAVKSRRLREAQRRELLQAGATATDVVDRLEVLEGQRLEYRRPPLRVQLTVLGGKVVMAGSALWAMRVIRHGPSLLVFGTVALAATAWLGWDVVNMFRRRAGRERIDAEVEALLAGGEPEDPEARKRLAIGPDVLGMPPP